MTEASRNGSTAASIALVLALVLALVGGCGGQTEPPRAVYVATLTEADGDGVSLAVVVEGDRVTAYACGDDPHRESYPGWFSGVAAEGRRSATMGHDGWSFSAAWSDDAVRGTLVEPDGEALPWSGARVRGDGMTGLYAAWDAGCVTGVIVAAGEDPAQPPIVRGAWCSDVGQLEQVTPVRPLELVDGRLPIEVAVQPIPRHLYATPVRTVQR